ncbi:MAG: nickel pincer cofactor biosynthesis protein LarB [Acidimicrobiia bacterium]|nr:nickel pincer cofactor biosynthesis protein LarB [Acidimicrobiia bacterium]
MDEVALRRLIDDVRTGACAPDDAVAVLRRLPFADLGFARVDHHRTLRQGMAEAVYAPGKTAEHCVAIVGELLDAGASPVILSRTDDEQANASMAAHPGGTRTGHTVVWRRADTVRHGRVVVISAGTADAPVATEVVTVLEAHGLSPRRLDDCGVAGLHRLLVELDHLAAADAVVVIAGMEGALASVVGGLTAAPVVAVPTSVGYGSSLEGVTALLSMHAACASGITVVGIDNGFGAASAVLRLLPMRESRP